jgi:hypothetical protein
MKEKFLPGKHIGKMFTAEMYTYALQYGSTAPMTEERRAQFKGRESSDQSGCS